MRDLKTVMDLFRPLWDDVDDGQNFFKQKPLLAHYTSLMVLEKIVETNLVWFGNPLFMNDREEVRFGIDEGTRMLLSSEILPTKLDAAYRYLLPEFHRRFFAEHAFDTYVLCLSQHVEGDTDGILSMWRGYGDAGNGAAIVFDARNHEPVEDTPLIISKVVYASREDRYKWFKSLAANFHRILVREEIEPEEMAGAVSSLFNRLRLFALFTKHKGFEEEKEWRLAYLPERDRRGLLKPYLDYFNGPRGIEPKLKVPIQPIPELDPKAIIALGTMVHSIITGPSSPTDLTRLSVQRMLRKHGHTELADRVVGSQIPFRPVK